MRSQQLANDPRRKRHLRIRKKISGTATRPRLCVFRSLNNLYAQLIDDEKGHTLVGVSTLSPEIKSIVPYGGNVAAAKEIGKLLAKKALEKNIASIVLDRSGYQYHGRIAALAEEVRQNGIKF